jgi:LAO/AO transport system kinase
MLDRLELARAATRIERGSPHGLELGGGRARVVGITGAAGVGKSTLVGALIDEIRSRGKSVAVIAVDPSSPISGGALLGDRVRMEKHHADPQVFIRSMASRGAAGGLAQTTRAMTELFSGAGFDYALIETVGVGQGEIEIAKLAAVTVVVLAPGMGDDVQALKAGLMEVADLFAINKADRDGAGALEQGLRLAGVETPVVRTVATDGAGVAELLDAIDALPGERRRFAGRAAIDHLGIAVRSIDAALAFYRDQLGLTVAARETVETEKVHVAMLPTGESRIELLQAASPDSVIAKFVEKRGEGLHHVALRVPDLDAAVARLKSAGARLLNDPRPGAGGHIYVFVHPSSTGGVLLELIQE